MGVLDDFGPVEQSREYDGEATEGGRNPLASFDSVAAPNTNENAPTVTLRDIFQGADALQDIVNLFGRALVQFTGPGMRELMLMENYSPLSKRMAQQIRELKYHQTPGAAGKLLKLMQAAAYNEKLDKMLSAGRSGGDK